MFIGHFALGFAAKRAAPRLSLGATFLAAQFVDLLWPTLLLAGVEAVRIVPGFTAVTPLAFDHYPVSHSLVAALLWAIVLGIAWGVWSKDRRSGAVVGVLVASHWFLDALVHVRDLPLVPGGDVYAGLGLWRSHAATLLLEVPIFAAGVALYLRATRARDRAGQWGLWSLVGLLALIYLANLFGPPPERAGDIAWVGQAQWLLVLWAWWVDRHRVPATRASAVPA